MKAPIAIIAALLLATPLISSALAAESGNPATIRLTPVPIQQVKIEDAFWSPRIKTWREVTIPDSLAKFEKDGTLLNFDRVRDGQLQEKHGGAPWFDGLIYEMIRACSDYLAAQREPAMEQRLDSYIERIAAAQAKDPDGYLNTYTQMAESTHRWGLSGGNDMYQHDIYNTGCLIEAAVHYYRATGKTSLLKVAARLANNMCDVIGPQPKANMIPGHSGPEEALVLLFELFRERPELKKEMGFPVEEQRYLKLAEFFIEGRGHYEGRKSFNAYGQDHKPVFEQETIEGHAVRATLYRDGADWKAVEGASEYGTKSDQFNQVNFTPVTTRALRIEVQLQPNFSAGILEWKVQ